MKKVFKKIKEHFEWLTDQWTEIDRWNKENSYW
jgi:hypothetical protein